MAGISVAGTGQCVGDRGRAIHRGEGEASGIQMVEREHACRTRATGVAAGANGVERGTQRPRAPSFHVARRRTSHVGQRGRPSGAEIEHAAAAGVPESRVVALDVGVLLV